MDIVAYVAVGAAAGLLQACSGSVVAGSWLRCSLLLFDLRGDLPAVAASGALATSTAAILFTAIPSSLVHAMHRSLDWRMLMWICPTAIIGSAVAAQFAQVAPPVLLVAGLAVFLAYGGRRVLQQRNAPDVAMRVPLHPVKLGAVGLPAGIIGTLTGTGGGIFVVPALVHLKVPLINAIGTSAGNTFFVALGGSLSYAGTGVDVRVLLAMAPTCVLFALAGAHFANQMPRRTLSIVYASLLLVLIVGLLRWIIVKL